MNLLLTLAVLFNDDLSMPEKLEKAAIEAKIEDLNTGNILNRECVLAIKKIQNRKRR